MEVKTNVGLVEYCTKQLGNPYWYGTWGKIGTIDLLTKKSKQYPSQYTAARIAIAKAKHLGLKVHDCVGLIKGYLWTEGLTGTAVYNKATDKNVGGMLKICSETGLIANIPDTPGILVFKETSHVGIYIGDGYIIEAKGFNEGVIKGKLSADNDWNKWGKLSLLTYKTKEVNPYAEPTKDLKKGSRGTGVKWIQWYLDKYGYDLGKYGIDGDFGTLTLKAVKAFQKANKLTVDGIVGKLTRAKFKSL